MTARNHTRRATHTHTPCLDTVWTKELQVCERERRLRPKYWYQTDSRVGQPSAAAVQTCTHTEDLTVGDMSRGGMGMGMGMGMVRTLVFPRWAMGDWPDFSGAPTCR